MRRPVPGSTVGALPYVAQSNEVFIVSGSPQEREREVDALFLIRLLRYFSAQLSSATMRPIPCDLGLQGDVAAA